MNRSPPQSGRRLLAVATAVLGLGAMMSARDGDVAHVADHVQNVLQPERVAHLAQRVMPFEDREAQLPLQALDRQLGPIQLIPEAHHGRTQELSREPSQPGVALFG